ncbi:4Fe-4S dicluster domain-containing protein [Spirochaetota bacterium]
MMKASGNNGKKKVGAVLVVGGGIAGIQASIDLAEAGQKVYLLTNSPSIGGNMPRLDKTFPTNDCSMCILSPKLVQAGRHINIELVTCSELEDIKGSAGHFTVKVKTYPRHVDIEKCTGCALCGKVDVPDVKELIEHDGELWVDRIKIDEVKCVQCGDCVRSCLEENPDEQAMSSVREEEMKSDAPAASAEEKNTSHELRKLLAMNKEERIEYWQHEMSKCIKCYGCRDICPVFVDKECRLEDWAKAGMLPPDAPGYHLARAYYISKRCTHCGFCEETCPGKLPLRTLVDLIRHEEADTIFKYVPGLTEEVIQKIRTSFPAKEKKSKETHEE